MFAVWLQKKKMKLILKKATLTFDLVQNELLRYCSPKSQEQFKIQNIQIRSMEQKISTVEKIAIFHKKNLNFVKQAILKIFTNGFQNLHELILNFIMI